MSSKKSLFGKLKDGKVSIPSLLIFIFTAFIIIFLMYHLASALAQLFIDIHGYFVTDTTSARYILSAIVQSEAAIMGITFTGMLIIFQVLAAAGVERSAIKNFLKSRKVLVTILVYAATIGYSLTLLNLIKDNNTEVVNVFLPVFLMMFSIFFSLGVLVIMVHDIYKKSIAGGVRVGTQKVWLFGNSREIDLRD